MTLVTFEDYTPRSRYPPVLTPWTRIQIQETADPLLGPWIVIEDFPITEIGALDADPTDPASRSFSTTEATLAEGWYRVVFLDAEGSAEYTDPKANFPLTDAIYATPDDLREELDEDLPDDVATNILMDASDEVDSMLGPWPLIDEGDWTGRKIDLTWPELTVAELDSLRRATVKLARIAHDDVEGLSSPRKTSVSGPDFSESYATGEEAVPRLRKEARRILLNSGLVRTTTSVEGPPMHPLYARSPRSWRVY